MEAIVRWGIYYDTNIKSYPKWTQYRHRKLHKMHRKPEWRHPRWRSIGKIPPPSQRGLKEPRVLDDVFFSVPPTWMLSPEMAELERTFPSREFGGPTDVCPPTSHCDHGKGSLTFHICCPSPKPRPANVWYIFPLYGLDSICSLASSSHCTTLQQTNTSYQQHCQVNLEMSRGAFEKSLLGSHGVISMLLMGDS